MENKFADYMIPREENAHQPRMLRSKTVLLIATAVLILEIAFLFGTLVIAPRSSFVAAILPSVLVESTNVERSRNLLSELNINPSLQEAARLKAQDMASKGYFAHTSPEGITPWHWFKEVGYRYTHAGENLAVNFVDSEEVVEAWMNSPGHRANILNTSFTEIGIGAVKGTYEGRPAIFVVQLFGKPATVASAPAEPNVVPPSSTEENNDSTGEGDPEVASAEAEEEIPEPVIVRLAEEKPDNLPAQEMFVAVEATEDSSEKVEEVVVSNEEPVPVASVERSGSTLTLAGLITSPRTATQYLYYAIAVLMAIAIVLKVMIRIDIQYPRLVLNGMLVLIFVAGLIILNQEITVIHAAIF